MSSSEDRDIEPFDWLNRFFGGSRRSGRGGGEFFGFPYIFRGFAMQQHHNPVWMQD
jgi:hypothetical protein